MWRILLSEFLGDLKAHKTRALLTMFAITWGTIAVVLLLAFGEGLRRTINRGLLNAGERIFMVWGGQTSRDFEGLPRGRRIPLTEDDMQLVLRFVNQIEAASPSYGRWGVTLSYGDVKTTTYMEGVHPPFSEMRRMFPKAGGRFINQADVDERRRVLFLGDTIAYRIFGTEDPVGKELELEGVPFTVVGVMQAKFQDSNNNGPDENRAIIPASTYRAMYGDRYVNHLLFKPKSVERAELTKQEIYEVLGARHRFDPEDERALGIWDFIEDAEQTQAIGMGIQVFLGLVGLFTLIVAGVGVANIMYVVVKERTREIGVKLAVGARKSHIMAQFMFEALAISVIGGTAGMLFSVGAVLLVDAIPASNPAMNYIANPKLSWTITLACGSILMLIGLLSGFLPARKAARMDPVESLRYE
ncbi:MAG: ABC transporter permease [marine benthic group bacterium]|jgi:putative ABC transport system permease protein|nr:ABC transporter permease [Candidatus Benthicola marisminoris]